MLETTNPRQVILVTSKGIADLMGKNIEKENVMAATWHTPLSFKEPLYGVAIREKTLTCKLIRESKVFCINFPSTKLERQTAIAGTLSGAHQDKFQKAGFEKEQCDTIDCPRIKDIDAYMECELQQEMTVGDHILFIGKASKVEMTNKTKRLFHVDGNKYTTTK